jgi:hypothetical protein
MLATYGGTWLGTTAQGLPFSFAVTENRVTEVSFSFTVAASPPCEPLSGSVSVTLPTPAAIAPGGAGNGSEAPGFHVAARVPTEQLSLDVTGSFAAADEASGSLAFGTQGVGVPSLCAPSGSSTWTARRQG